MSALGFLVAATFGAVMMRAIVGRRRVGTGDGLAAVVLGAGFGIALLSALRFALLVAGLSPLVCRVTEGGLVVAACVALSVRLWGGRSEGVAPDEPSWSRGRGYVVGIAVLVLLIGVQISLTAREFAKVAENVPYGMWDAWGIWNTRAKMLAQPNDGWRHAFHDTFAHVDYPLLLPLTVLRGWEWVGTPNEVVGFVTSIAFFALTGVVLFATLRSLRGSSAGLMAVALYLATGLLQAWGPAQYADVPLAMYYVAALACMALAVERPEQSGRWLFALGLSLTAAAWTKNEGLPWAAVGVVTTLLVIALRGVPRHGFLWFVAGLLPLGATLVAFKLGYAGPNDLVEGQAGGKPLDKLLDPARHALIWKYLVATVPRSILWLPVVGLLLGVRRGVGLRVSLWLFAQLAAIVAAYYAVYLLTPHDLNWHLGTSLDRIVLQVWPGFLFAMFYLLRTPEEVLASSDGPADDGRPPGFG